MVPLMKASPRDGSFALASLGSRSTVHEPILNRGARKWIVDIFPLACMWLALFEQVATYFAYPYKI